MAAIAGLRGTGDWATDERPKNFREYILFRNPNGTAPLFAMTAKMKKETVDDPEFSWWDEPNDIVRLQINAGAGYVAADTVLTVDSGDPDATAANVNKVWGLAKHLKPGDHLLVEPTADVATFDHEVVEVVQVNSDTEIVVSRGAQGTTPAAIANDQFLLKIGSAYAEGTAEPEATSRNPIKYTNYTQIFKDAYEITGTAEETKTRTGDPVKNDKKRKAFDHARDIEFAMMFGRKSEVTGDNGKPKRTMSGLRAFIPGVTTTIFSAAPTTDTILDAISPVFNFDSEAGNTRIAFAGNGALNILNKKIAAASGAIKIDFSGSVKWFGMTFNEYRVPQGTILIKTHPLMSRHTLYTNAMFIVDPSAIRYRPLKNRDTRMKDDVQNKGEDLRRGFWQTECGIEVRYGGLTCGYIGKWNA